MSNVSARDLAIEQPWGRHLSLVKTGSLTGFDANLKNLAAPSLTLRRSENGFGMALSTVRRKASKALGATLNGQHP